MHQEIQFDLEDINLLQNFTKLVANLRERIWSFIILASALNLSTCPVHVEHLMIPCQVYGP